MKSETEIRRKLSKELLYLYNTGKCYHAYRTFGAQLTDGGVQFTVWAPDVKAVRVLGDFNGWGSDSCLEPLGSTGTWTGFISKAKAGDRYKYEIETQDGRKLLKADPFAFGSEKRPKTASVITDLTYEWHDADWLSRRADPAAADGRDMFHSPMNIYEVHPGSWKRHPAAQRDEMVTQRDEAADNFYTYDDLAETLVPYVKEMGYTHIEILPVMEHPLDASWGYQVTGYYSATARYGHPTGLKKLIDCCHANGIGVILDWVPGHFCPDEHGLAEFNGGPLYESEIHPDWGTYKFDFGRGQVRSFLLSNAMFWLEEFHADGIRVDGVSSMLYLNFGVPDDQPKKLNIHGDEGNLEAIEFIKELNYMIGTEPAAAGVFTAAEESSAWPMVTWPPSEGGLGFHFKWNMGWMNDTLEYMESDFPYRPHVHNKLTFSMTYAYTENFILPLSHDEVVHGKKSLIGRMPGDTWREFAGMKMLAVWQMTHPGRKLNFMGQEIAQFIEWREYEELEWFLLKYENHANHQKFMMQLNRFYLEHPALWENDTGWEGFAWGDADNNEQGVLTYFRFADRAKAIQPGDVLAVVINTGVKDFARYRIGVPAAGRYRKVFGPEGSCTGEPLIMAEPVPMHGQEYSIEINVPVISGTIYELAETAE